MNLLLLTLCCVVAADQWVRARRALSAKLAARAQEALLPAVERGASDRSYRETEEYDVVYGLWHAAEHIESVNIFGLVALRMVPGRPLYPRKQSAPGPHAREVGTAGGLVLFHLLLRHPLLAPAMLLIVAVPLTASIAVAHSATRVREQAGVALGGILARGRLA